MSGGFFRGTSADQDTRFSNKQAKLLKSQKFAPELDHLVDMTKVKMDVIRPWIATRATELLGFEDEVLINFIYGLLDGKVVDGKKIQIQLTGFMEKNTGKFMKELWILLLSAQNNLSGVPQQFLDAKEEEQRKKKEENERISQEIQKRKERTGRELEREKLARMDAEDIDLKPHKTGPDLVSRPRASNGQLEEERKEDENYTLKRDGHFLSPHRSNPLPLSQRSSSASRSSSREGHKSRSASMCSQSPRHSISPKKRSHSPIRRSPTHIRHYRSPHRRLNSRSPIRRSPLASRSPIRRLSVASQSPIRKRSPRTFGSPIRRSPRTSRSPIRRRSPHSRRRSISRSRDRYPSPYYRRSNARRRSPYLHHRSPSPLCRRSPSSPSPVRCRSPPVRRRSPLPLHRRSRSPRRRSPIHLRRRSPSPPRHRSPARHVSPSPPRYESLSPVRKRSPLTKSSRYKKQSPSQSPIRQHSNSRRSLRQRSPSPRKSASPSIHRSFHNEHNNFAGKNVSGRPCDERAQRTLSAHNNKVKEIVNIVGSDKPPNHFTSMTVKRISSRKRSRSISRSRSPVVQIGGSLSRHEISDANKEEKRSPHARDVAHHKNDVSHKRNAYLSTNFENSYKNDHTLNELFPDRTAQFPSTQHVVKSEIKLNDTGDRQRKNSQQALKLQEDVEYGPGGTRGGRDCSEDVKMLSQDKSPERRRSKEYEMHSDARYVAHKMQSISKDTEYEEALYVREHGKRSKKKLDKDYHLISNYSESDDAQDIEKQQHKRLDSYKQKFSESSEDDSPIEDKKEAKRKKKEERRLRKEERRKMREERRRRRSERRAVRQKVRSMDALSTPSDIEKIRSDSGDSDGTFFKRKHSHTSIDKETESEQKRLEFELRKRALESLRAKKAIND